MTIFEDIKVDIKVELGATTMPVHHVLRLGRGAVIELDATENDPVKLYANDTLVAEGEIRIDDGSLAIEITRKVEK
ncbi:MAG TPA: flagellar motor switch protein FliN [Devosia sp.]|nr:flagellar motor switch protein FliN [Devosia sp.]